MAPAKPKKRLAAALLSFGDDAEAEEEFVVAKGVKRVAKAHTHSTVRTAPTSQANTYLNVSSGYSAEELETLKKNSFHWGHRTPTTAISALHEMQTAYEGAEDAEDDSGLPSELDIRQAKLKRELARRSVAEPAGPALAPLTAPAVSPEAAPSSSATATMLPAVPTAVAKAGANGRPVVTVDSDSDEGGMEYWERHQMDKAGVRRGAVAADVDVDVGVGVGAGRDRGAAGGPRGALPGLAGEPLPGFEELCRSVRTTLQHMRKHCTQSSSAHSQVAQEVQVASHAAQALSRQLKDLTQQLQFFTEFKDYLEDLADCYDEKEKLLAEKVQELEQLHVDYFKDRMDTYKKDLKDEMEEVRIMCGLQTEEEEEVDEFGRSLVRVKQARALRRRELHRKRQQKRLNNRRLDGVPEGWSTDETDSEDEDRYSVRISRHLEGIAGLLEDVDGDYASLAAIHRRLEHFKCRYGAAYKDSYANLSLALAFGPHVAIELAGWNPLKRHRPLAQFDFVRLLCDFGAATRESCAGAELDLVPGLVRDKVLPLATLYVCNAYNPLSEQQTLNARRLVADLLRVCSPTSPEMKQLFFAVVDTLKTMVAALAVDHSRWTFDAAAQAPGGTDAAARAFAIVHRRFWAAVKLLHNTRLWQHVLSPAVLRNIAVKHLLCQRLLPHLRTLAVHTTPQLARTAALLRRCLDELPDPGPGGWREPGLQEEVRPVFDFIRSHLVAPYRQLPRDPSAERAMHDVWGTIGGDPAELQRLLSGADTAA